MVSRSASNRDASGADVAGAPASGASDVQRRLPDRVITALGRYRRGGRRGRTVRRLAAVALLLVAGALALRSPPPDDQGTVVYAAAHDIAIGTALNSDDVRRQRVRTAPHGVLTSSASIVGRVAASPIRAGEVLTDVRLVGENGPDPGPGRTAVPIRLPDSGLLGLLRPGMRVAVVTIDEDSRAHRLTAEAVVLSLPAPGEGGLASAARHPIVVLAVPDAVADAATTAAMTSTVALRFS